MAGGDAPERLADVRRSYGLAALSHEDLSDAERADPLRVLRRWLEEAVADGRTPEPTAMVLATVRQPPPVAGGGAGVDAPTGGVTTPGAEVGADARVVLCKGVDDGVVFYTNRRSAKGDQLASTPVAAVVFHWPVLERQVRCRGRVHLLDDATSDEYFASRPRGSRLGAWASAQSQRVADRDELEARAAQVAARFAGTDVPRPPHWGGYRLVPDEVELWQGRPSRLHDRLLARRVSGGWDWVRLQP